MHGLAQFGADGDDEVRLDHGVDGRRRESVWERPVLQALDEGGATGGLDHRAVHQLRERLDGFACAVGVHGVPDEQDRLLGLANEFGCPLDHLGARTLVHQPVRLGRQRLGHVEFLEDDVRRVLDVGRSRRSGLRDAQCVADDLVGLVGVFDARRVLHRRLDHGRLLDELDTTAADALLGDARALAAKEDHRGVLDLGALDRAGEVGQPRAERADGEPRLAGHPGHGLGHEACVLFVVRSDDGPATLLGGVEHVHEVRIGNAEQRVDALGFEQLQDSLVNLHGHSRLSPISLVSPVSGNPAARSPRWCVSRIGGHATSVNCPDKTVMCTTSRT